MGNKLTCGECEHYCKFYIDNDKIECPARTSERKLKAENENLKIDIAHRSEVAAKLQSELEEARKAAFSAVEKEKELRVDAANRLLRIAKERDRLKAALEKSADSFEVLANEREAPALGALQDEAERKVDELFGIAYDAEKAARQALQLTEDKPKPQERAEDPGPKTHKCSDEHYGICPIRKDLERAHAVAHGNLSKPTDKPKDKPCSVCGGSEEVLAGYAPTSAATTGFNIAEPYYKPCPNCKGGKNE